MLEQVSLTADSAIPRPAPFWFTSGNAHCFGVLHLPVAQPLRGVVIANGLGFDGLLAHRTLRILAQQMTARGLAVLRFDLAGSGDSSGGEWEPDRVPAWIDSIENACSALRTQAGIDDIHLLGYRMGAPLALLAAERSQNVAAVSLWAPCSTGRSYVRELKALANFRASTRPRQPPNPPSVPDDLLEVVGFEFTPQTLASLSTLDVAESLVKQPAPLAFVLDRSDGLPSNKLVGSLRTLGVAVDHGFFDGYQEFMTDDETTAVMPDQALNDLINWHCAAPAREFPNHRPVRIDTQLTLLPADAGRFTKLADPTHPDTNGPAHLLGVTESAEWIENRLLAITTRTVDEHRAKKTVVVIANTGTVNRSGPGRLHVPLARFWASIGYTVIRVDLGGSGDSTPADPATENSPYAGDRVHELRAVIETARALPGIDSVVAFGMCSGAYNNLQAALHGAPVDGVVLVNQLIFSLDGEASLATSRDRAVLSANRLSVGLAKRTWTEVRTRHGGLVGAARRAHVLVREGAIRGYAQMWSARLRHRAVRIGFTRYATPNAVDLFRSLSNNGTRVALVFADDEPGELYLRAIGGATFQAAVDTGAVHLLKIPGGDHVFSPPGARLQFVSEVTNWLQQNYPG